MDGKSPGFRISDLARKVINVDGKMLGKDGKPLLARRNVIHNSDIGNKTHTDGSVSSTVGQEAGVYEISKATVDSSGHVGSSSGEAGLHAGHESTVDGSTRGMVGVLAPPKSDEPVIKDAFTGSQDPTKVVTPPVNGENVSKDDGKPPKVDAAKDSNEVKTPIPSFASVVNNEKPKAKVNFRKVETKAGPNGEFEAMIPVSSVKEVNDRLSNSIYGYFIGKRLAFPVVENYVRNSWGKYGIQKVMMNAKGIYFFKFASQKGVDDVLQNGPWMIRNIPIILNIWTPNACLSKENHDTVPVWVKLQEVPLVAFTADGLSVIASKVGNPIMMDAYTSAMCEESWGRSSYARVMIEISASDALKEEVVVAIPNVEDDGYVCAKIRIEYEWRPPHCGKCKIFGHDSKDCPNAVKPQVVKESGKAKESGEPNANTDGFQQVKPKPFRGLVVGNQKKVSVGKTKKVYVPKNQNKEASKTSTSNSFEALNKIDPKVENAASASKKLDDQVEEKQVEDRGKKAESSSTGFFTLADDSKERKAPSLYERWKQTDGYEDDDSDDVLDSYDYDMTDYLDSQERQSRRKS